MLRIAEHWHGSDLGLQRQGNEDNYFVRAPLFVVADGMGGAQAGEVASEMAVEAFAPGSAYDLSDGALLGRGDQADIRLEDGFASARHARLVPQGDVMVLEDLGSTNGTYLNGEPLRGPQPLHVGDRIRIGDSEFSFER